MTIPRFAKCIPCVDLTYVGVVSFVQPSHSRCRLRTESVAMCKFLFTFFVVQGLVAKRYAQHRMGLLISTVNPLHVSVCVCFLCCYWYILLTLHRFDLHSRGVCKTLPVKWNPGPWCFAVHSHSSPAPTAKQVVKDHALVDSHDGVWLPVLADMLFI